MIGIREGYKNLGCVHREPTITDGSNQQILVAAFLFSCLFFVVQALFFKTAFRPDEAKALDTFSHIIVGRPFDVDAENLIRLVIYMVDIFIVVVLRMFRLINRRTMILGLCWPLTTFLFSKIYWEFLVFPFCLIRIDLRLKSELALIVAMILAYVIFGEANILVVAAFRCVLAGQKLGYTVLAPLGFLSLAVLINLTFETGLHERIPFIGQELQRFSWTREMINPEYSILETLPIFFSSMHFFTMHTGMWWIDLLFTIVVLTTIASRSDLSMVQIFMLPQVLAFSSILLGMTEITHVFQNARYYLFFVPVMATFVTEKTAIIVGALGVAHVLMKTVEVVALA